MPITNDIKRFKKFCEENNGKFEYSRFEVNIYKCKFDKNPLLVDNITTRDDSIILNKQDSTYNIDFIDNKIEKTIVNIDNIETIIEGKELELNTRNGLLISEITMVKPIGSNIIITNIYGKTNNNL